MSSESEGALKRRTAKLMPRKELLNHVTRFLKTQNTEIVDMSLKNKGYAPRQTLPL
jgi:hypothetical protein